MSLGSGPLESPLGLGRKGEALAAANSAVGLRGRAGPSLPGWGRETPVRKVSLKRFLFPRELRVSHPKVAGKMSFILNLWWDMLVFKRVGQKVAITKGPAFSKLPLLYLIFHGFPLKLV